MKPWIIVDTEADGPYPGDYSMVCFGAVVLDRKLNTRFYGEIAPISDKYDEETLKICGISRASHSLFSSPTHVMTAFDTWIKWVCKDESGPIFVADNPAWDFMWINYYFHKYLGRNPFGWSGRRIGDIWAGCQADVRKPWKHLRDTKHTHNPVDDALGNAEALIKMVDKYQLKPLVKYLGD
jgi:hypothetical protein